MTIRIENEVTHKIYNFENLTDREDSRLFYHFDITLFEGMDDGIYDYTLLDEDDNVKATGLFAIGDFKAEKTEYTGNTVSEHGGYIQYSGD